MAAKLISVTIRDRQGVQFEGQVRAISGVNSKGPFDVLPIHTNFITILRKKLTLHKIDGTKQEIAADSGVMRVLQDKIEVYLGVA